MSIESRLTALEELLGCNDNSVGWGGIPKAWLTVDRATGKTINPPPGIVPTEAQQRTLALLRRMRSAVPCVAP